MLAILAMQDILDLDITVKQIPIYNQENSSSLGQAFYNELIANSSITGYRVDTKAQPPRPNCEHLNVFCVKKNNREIPFAMYMPSMLICPFKSYPLDIFDGIEWYDSSTAVFDDPNKDPKATWKPLTTCRIIDDGTANLTRTAIGLITWIQSAVANVTAPDLRDILVRFEKDLINNKPFNPGIAVNLTNTSYSSVNELLPSITKKIDHRRVRFFSDALLAIIPPSGFNGNQIGDALIKVAENGKEYYIVPPIHNDLVCEIRDGHAEIDTLDITVNRDINNNISGYLCEIRVKNLPGGDIVTKSHTFNEAEITYTECMPYISMWPFVNFENDSWKQHYVAIVANDESEDANLNQGTMVYDDFRFFFDSRFKHLRRRTLVTDQRIEFALVAKSSEAEIKAYDSLSKYVNPVDRAEGNKQEQEFTLLSSTSTPYALEFFYTDSMGTKHTLGTWTIKRDHAPTFSGTGIAPKTVAMDFGTTSTNIYIADNPIANVNQQYLQRSVYSPGKYVHDIYCPLSKEKRKFIQKYYLFSDSSELLGKIFTYGQNFDAKLENKDCSHLTISNVTGRLIEIDKDFISDSTNLFENQSRILTNLKWPKVRDNNDFIDREREKAAKNFILNALTYGVLEAKTEGANRVEIRISYPGEEFGNIALDASAEYKKTLAEISGIENIEILGQTEAKAAGKYFEKHPTVQHRPTPNDGYAIIDIGGGTTDFSFWKGDKIPELKAEHSFGYAGNYLVEKSIIQTVKDLTSFKKLWDISDEAINNSEIEAAKNYIISNLPYRKIAIIDFLLENKGINYDRLTDDEFKKLCLVVNAKYCGLFYLIASYMKNKLDKKEIELSPYTFRICMAGCGAKGISLAAKTSNINRNIEVLFKTILKLDKNLNFHITSSTSDDKEEVVIGLTLLSKNEMTLFGDDAPNYAVDPVYDDLERIMADDSVSVDITSFEPESTDPEGEEVDTTIPAINFSIPDRETLKKSYTVLIKFLTALGMDLKALNVEESPKAYNVFLDEFSTLVADMEDINYDPDTYKEFFALMMLEKMIEKLI